MPGYFERDAPPALSRECYLPNQSPPDPTRSLGRASGGTRNEAFGESPFSFEALLVIQRASCAPKHATAAVSNISRRSASTDGCTSALVFATKARTTLIRLFACVDLVAYNKTDLGAPVATPFHGTLAAAMMASVRQLTAVLIGKDRT